MADINNIIARFTSDPQVVFTNDNGTSLIRFSVCKTVRKPAEKGSAEYKDSPVYIENFEYLTSSARLPYLKKGTLVVLSANFDNFEVTDKESGKKSNREFKRVTELDILRFAANKESGAVADDDAPF